MEEQQTLYGIWSTVSKKFVFGIKETSKTKARKQLFKEIGTDAYKWRFEVRKIPKQTPQHISRKVTAEELNQKAEEIIAILKQYGVVIQRYNSYTTKSIYLKFDYGVCNSLRISDHKGKKHLSYRYNLLTTVSHAHTTPTRQGWERHHFPLDETEKLAYKILDDREAKIKQYGLGLYKQFMYDNAVNNQDAKGFWQQAVVV